MRGTLRPLGCAVLLFCLFICTGPARGFVGIGVSVTPDSANVALGSIFNLTVYVDSIGTACSGFENTLAWDGTLLEFVSFQPESLLNERAWSEWRPPSLYPDSTHIYIVIYSFLGFLDEPGPLYSFTFRAQALGATPVGFSLARFGSAQSGGISPVLTHDGMVFITDPTSGIAPGPDRGLLDLRVAPNPLTADGSIQWIAPADHPARLEAFDVFGRKLACWPLPPGRACTGDPATWPSLSARELFADRGTDRGVVYLRLEAGAQARGIRVVLTR